MSKNKGKGGKNRRRGKNEADDDEALELVFKKNRQQYAQTLHMVGDGRLEAMYVDGIKCLCVIRGNMKGKVWIAAGDTILVGFRDYQDRKADVVHKCTEDEVKGV